MKMSNTKVHLLMAVVSLVIGACGSDSGAGNSTAPLNGDDSREERDSSSATDLAAGEDIVPYIEPTGERPQQNGPSSGMPCICWPDGDSCDRFGGGRDTDPRYRCPDGEVCLGGPSNVYNESAFSVCAKPCWHPQATDRVELDCADGDACVLQFFSWGFENQYVATQAYCVTRQSPGEPQPDSDPKYGDAGWIPDPSDADAPESDAR